MSRTIEVQLFKFEELSDPAKEKARDWYRRASVHDEWWNSVFDDAVQCADILGIDIAVCRGKTNERAIFFSGFSSQGDGASFNGSYAYAKGATKNIRNRAPLDKELHRIADELQKLQRSTFYRLACDITTSGHYSHSGTMSAQMVYGNRYYSNDKEESLQQLMCDFADWVYKQLETQYEWINADEQVDDNIQANEYEFTADGEIV